MCDICDWEALHPGETWPPPRIPEYGPPIDVGGLTIRAAIPRTVSATARIVAELEERNEHRDAAVARALAELFTTEGK